MKNDDSDQPSPRVTPAEALRNFKSETEPKEFQPSRRAVLSSMLGVATLSCGSSGDPKSPENAGAGGAQGSGGSSSSGGSRATGGGSASGGDSASGGNDPGTGGDSGQMGRSAYDLIELGSTGITISRLAMGSGTNGYDGSSVQTRMEGEFTRLLVQGYERGIRFFETADAYGAHGRVGEAMREVGRQNVTLLTKTMAETREEAEADLNRFMEELGTDYIDIVLLHIRESATWTSESGGAMDVLSEAKARGQIRAHGVSCHTLQALRLAGETDWVDVDLARINPFGLHMDADPDTVISELEAMKNGGKGVLGMKILAQGDAVDRFDESIEHATRLDCIHGFTIGFTSIHQLDQVADKISRV